ncbi:hypothetical protein J7E66_24680, partial [Bacillus sp. ISL-7]|nr:hypothetical protein [Bacillus sp. ISL-7]
MSGSRTPIKLTGASVKEDKKSRFLNHQVNCTRIVRHTLTIRGAFFMVKFSPEEKIQAVKEYLSGNDGGKTI